MGVPPSRPQAAWPDHCCVAAFVWTALRMSGVPVPDRDDIARRLGTCVGPLDDNPWSLTVVADPQMRGVPSAAAENAIPSLLLDLNLPLCFPHVSFASVTLGLYEELLSEAVLSGCIAGVGYDHAMLTQRKGVSRHVCRVQPGERTDHVRLIDDATGDPPTTREVSWLRLEQAVRSLGDGFWLLGEQDALSLTYAPPWPSGRAHE